MYKNNNNNFSTAVFLNTGVPNMTFTVTPLMILPNVHLKCGYWRQPLSLRRELFGVWPRAELSFPIRPLDSCISDTCITIMVKQPRHVAHKERWLALGEDNPHGQTRRDYSLELAALLLNGACSMSAAARSIWLTTTHRVLPWNLYESNKCIGQLFLLVSEEMMRRSSQYTAT